eukprot:COSAG06_NODE_82_length_25183_cov_133.214240_24_plen_79_part_00
MDGWMAHPRVCVSDELQYTATIIHGDHNTRRPQYTATTIHGDDDDATNDMAMQGLSLLTIAYYDSKLPALEVKDDSAG